jgi:hypothetical protein
MTEKRKKYQRYPPLEVYRVDLPGDLAQRITAASGIADPELMPGMIATYLSESTDQEIRALALEIDKVLEKLPVPEQLRRFTA